MEKEMGVDIFMTFCKVVTWAINVKIWAWRAAVSGTGGGGTTWGGAKGVVVGWEEEEGSSRSSVL
jgi:hypothetical protein